MQIGITCPMANNDVTITTQGSQQTICVAGTFTTSSMGLLKFFRLLAAWFRALLSWLLRLFGAPRAPAVQPTIRVRIVVAGAPAQNPAFQQGDVNITPP